MSTPFYDELQEIEATLRECLISTNVPEPIERRVKNAIELVRDAMRRLDDLLRKGGKVEPAPAPTFSLFPVASTPLPMEYIEVFKLASELAVRADRRLDFIESGLRLRLEGWKIQSEYEQDSRARGLIRGKIEEVERILANARA